MAAVAAAMESGASERDACGAIGVSVATLWRWRRAYAAGGVEALEDGRAGASSRRPVAEQITADAAAYVRRLAVASGSVASAFDDLADNPDLCPDTLRAYLLGRKSRHRIAGSLRRAVAVTPEVDAMRHGPKRFDEQAYIGLRDMTQIDLRTGARVPIEPGDWWELDDQSTNQPFWFEIDPADARSTRQGTADALAVRHGCGIGRQGLFAVDVASGRWLACVLVGRPRDAYRAEDILRFLRRMFEDYGLPRRGLRLERGVWKSQAITGATEMPDTERRAVVAGLQSLGIQVEYVFKSRGKPFVEGGFDHLQTRMAIEAEKRGLIDIGRHRTDFEREAATMQRCKAGVRHPRDCGFPHVSELASVYQDAFAFLNAHEKEGRLQIGVPDLRWQVSIESQSLAALKPEHAGVFMPIKFATELRGGHVQKTLAGRIYRFALPELAAQVGNGYRLRACFDPGDPWRGAEVYNLEDGTRNIRNLRPGAWMATAEWAEAAPQFGAAVDAATLEQRKRYSIAFRAVYAASGVGGRRGRVARESRTDRGLVVRTEAPAGGEAMATTRRCIDADNPSLPRARTDQDLDRAEADAAVAMRSLDDLAMAAS